MLSYSQSYHCLSFFVEKLDYLASQMCMFSQFLLAICLKKAWNHYFCFLFVIIIVIFLSKKKITCVVSIHSLFFRLQFLLCYRVIWFNIQTTFVTWTFVFSNLFCMLTSRIEFVRWTEWISQWLDWFLCVIEVVVVQFFLQFLDQTIYVHLNCKMQHKRNEFARRCRVVTKKRNKTNAASFK